jgi:osmotically inducible protein OsmC
MAAKRTAKVDWTGDLATGSGKVDFVSSGAVSGLDVSWSARTEQPGGKTSPEELIAAALASCFSMAFSAGLARAGHPPQHLNVEATSAFEKGDDGFDITSMDLTVRGRVPGLDEAGFRQAAEEAGRNCPVAKALRNNVKISVDAALE